jgi:hypothetical protein
MPTYSEEERRRRSERAKAMRRDGRFQPRPRDARSELAKIVCAELAGLTAEERRAMVQRMRDHVDGLSPGGRELAEGVKRREAPIPGSQPPSNAPYVRAWIAEAERQGHSLHEKPQRESA